MHDLSLYFNTHLINRSGLGLVFLGDPSTAIHPESIQSVIRRMIAGRKSQITFFII
jgi:hypothetical protein